MIRMFDDREKVQDLGFVDTIFWPLCPFETLLLRHGDEVQWTFQFVILENVVVKKRISSI